MVLPSSVWGRRSKAPVSTCNGGSTVSAGVGEYWRGIGQYGTGWMRRQGSDRDGGLSPTAPGDAPSARTLSRRQALGRMSAVATAGAAAWVAPEIMTAKPAAGASLSLARGGGGGDPPGQTPPPPPTGLPPLDGPTAPASDGPTSTPGTGTSTSPAITSGAAAIPSRSLAFTGVDLQRDAEIGAALIAGGWAMHHWASRRPNAASEGAGRTGAARSADTPT